LDSKQALPDPGRFAVWGPLFADLEWVYTRLADEQSRNLLVDLVAYQILPQGRLKLATDTPEYWRQLAELERMAAAQRSTAPAPIGRGPRALLQHDLEERGLPIKVWTRLAAVHTQFVMQSYRCQRAGVDALPGEVVIDAGGCFGDTALLFAHKVGTDGQVFSFEFAPANIEIFRRNLELNPRLARQISIVERALWSHSDVELECLGDGPSTRVAAGAGRSAGSGVARSITLDDFAREAQLTRLDLVKMDIEGAEFEALRGAEWSLRTFRPDLALCVYHQPVDFVRLARAVDALELGYSYYLDHFTTIERETVLFCRSSSRGRRPSSTPSPA
jgi:FkbM family methyltransferase